MLPTAKKILSQFQAASLPFVSRMFRGNRLRRYAAVSGVLGLIAVLLGTWLAFGGGELERETRVELGMEQHVRTRSYLTYTVIYDDYDRYAFGLEQRDRLLAEGLDHETFGEVRSDAEDGRRTVARAARTPNVPASYADLQAAAVELDRRFPYEGALNPANYHLPWSHPDEVERLRAIVDAELVPSVEYYSSPLGLRDGLKLVGLVAGGFALMILLIGAPLAAGAQIAQEAHENTLQPLLGTRLAPRSLVVGLTAGPLAAAGVFAAPQLALYAMSALIAGDPIDALGFFAVTFAAAILITMITQLLGYGMGRKWASGLVGTVLTGLLSASMIAAVGVGTTIQNETVGLVSILPQSGSVHLLVETFLPQARLYTDEALLLDARMCFAAIAFIVLSAITVLALQRRITGKTQPALTRFEAGIAAVTLTLMAVSAMPEFGRSDAVAVYFVSLALLIIPFQVLLMGRVPTGDGPAALRNIPLTNLLAEFAGWIAMHAVVAFCVLQGNLAFSLGGTFYLAWALFVACLCAVRVSAIPIKLLSGLYVCFAMFGATMAFAFGGVMFAESKHGPEIFFALFEASPILGFVQLGLTVLIPWALVRALQKESAGVS